MILQSLDFDFPPLVEIRLGSSKIGICGGQFTKALAVSLLIVMIDKDLDLRAFEISLGRY